LQVPNLNCSPLSRTKPLFFDQMINFVGRSQQPKFSFCTY